ncbi:unnamed protein product [Coffea canephora]|uniref:Uncharacterized protein n=1 Tax=Coffea canephora TaxID=49390 RepID=A0A068UET7_COFCA|nr:unnamed protein product [Coffea canephora]
MKNIFQKMAFFHFSRCPFSTIEDHRLTTHRRTNPSSPAAPPAPAKTHFLRVEDSMWLVRCTSTFKH